MVVKKPRQKTLDDKDFHLFQNFIAERSGISFAADQKHTLATLLSERLAVSKFSSFSEYYESLRVPGQGQEEFSRLINLLTVQETAFFRYPAQYKIIRHLVLPELLSAKRRGGDRSLRLWSTACSTGEEAFSLAMTVLDAGVDPKEWEIEILATDINTEALAQARKGQFGKKSLARVDQDLQRRFFDRMRTGYRVKEEVSSLVNFVQLNLTDSQLSESVDSPFDIILCCNVFIYFDQETTQELAGRFSETLREGGYLFLGPSDTLWESIDGLSQVDIADLIIYQKQGKDRRKSQRPTEAADRILDDILRNKLNHNLIDLVKPPEPDRPSKKQTTSRPVKQAAAAETSKRIESRLAEAREMLAKGHVETVSSILTKVIELDTLCGEAYLLLGDSYTRQGRYREAIAELQKSLYCDQTLGLANFYLARIFEALGLDTAAEREYQSALDLLRKDNRDWQAYLEGFDNSTLADLCDMKIRNLKKEATNEKQRQGR